VALPEHGFEEWKFVPWLDAYGNNHPGVFQIVNGYTGQCLATPGTEPQNGSLLIMQPCGTYRSDQQAWAAALGGPIPGYQPLVSQTYGLRCLDLSNGDTSDGVPMQVWDCTPNTSNQQWTRISNSDGGGSGGGGCATSTPSSVHPAAIRPHRITCP
jgi:Ricin-type beta-trefoil lectin domain-like